MVLQSILTQPLSTMKSLSFSLKAKVLKQSRDLTTKD